MGKNILIKNGNIVTADAIFSGDILIQNGKIAKICRGGVKDETKTAADNDLCANAECEIVDVNGQFVLPGAVDVHTHFNLPVSGTVSADDYYTGSVACACGGVTTFFDYPTQEKGDSIFKTFKDTKNAIEGESCIDYAMHICITDTLSGRTFEDMKAIVSEGITSYKCYMVYPDIMVDITTLGEILKASKEAGALINVHAEDFDMLNDNLAGLAQKGIKNPYGHYLSRDEITESTAVRMVVDKAVSLGAPIYIVHTAAKESLDICIDAKEKGHKVLVETCPQYLEFTSEVFKREDGYKFICSPPMKSDESRQALINGINDGYVDVIATDHCPFMLEEKKLGASDFRVCPNGLMGVETMYPYMISRALNKEFRLEDVVKLCASNPARIFGCASKGSIEEGKDADIVLVNPEEEYYVNQSDMHSKCDYSVWDGMKLKGKITATYLRGEKIYDGVNFVGKRGSGEFVKCEKCC